MKPKGFTIKIKGGNRLTIMEGGMAQEVLYQKDKDQSMRLDRQNKGNEDARERLIQKYKIQFHIKAQRHKVKCTAVFT